jgi:hypothetical protein
VIAMADINIRAGSDARWRERAAEIFVYGFWVLAFGSVVSVISTTAGYRAGWDSTDGQHERSGMSLYVDHGTGCQYLGRIGVLTPRMQGDGKQAGYR